MNLSKLARFVPSRIHQTLNKMVVSRSTYDAVVAQCAEATTASEELERTYKTWVPPGHFYSPHPDMREVYTRAEQLFDLATPVGIDFREPEQLALLDELTEIVSDIPFPPNPSDQFRYYFDNPAYSWSDATVLHGMLRHIQPRRIVEVGSGYSSAMTLDTIDRWLDSSPRLTCVEPYPELLQSLLYPGDDDFIDIVDQPLQDIPLERFTTLQAGDLLFIDSTHVVKAASDVNYLVFEILPRLNDGVWVHVHDIFFPFEYPMEWLTEGRAWQEIYLLRAFLMFNDRFQIRWFQQFMWNRHRELLKRKIPLMENNSGGNIWLQKTGATRE